MTDMTPGKDYWQNAQGALIPAANVKDEDKLEDDLVRRMMAEAETLHEQLRAFKALAMGEAHGFRAMVAEQYGATKGGAKGNVTFRTYDGSMEMQVSVSDHIDLAGSQLSAAKELIDGCIERWSEGANDNLRVVVNDAFQVNKQGRIDTSRVLGLRRLNIDDPDWEKAMQAITDAVRITATRAYVRFYRTDEQGHRDAVVLDLARV